MKTISGFFKFLFKLIILLFLLAFVFGVIKPMYDDYKANKKEIVVDTSGELAMPKLRNEAKKAREEAAANKVETVGPTEVSPESIKDTATNVVSTVKEGIHDTVEEFKNGNAVLNEITEADVKPLKVDDRLITYGGKMPSTFISGLANVLIEDTDDDMYIKPDVKFVNISGLSSNEISYSNYNTYKMTLNQFKNSIKANQNYEVDFEYNVLRTAINKVIITKK